jgi:hypothetical protein
MVDDALLGIDRLGNRGEEGSERGADSVGDIVLASAVESRTSANGNETGISAPPRCRAMPLMQKVHSWALRSHLRNPTTRSIGENGPLKGHDTICISRCAGQR